MRKKKTAAFFELAIVIISLFAFSYILNEETSISDTSELSKISESRKGEISVFEAVLASIFSQIKKPSIPLVSAEETVGCCALSTTEDQCATTTPQNCAERAAFANYQTCGETSFCKRGCCYDDENILFSEGVLRTSCTGNWIEGSCDNIPASKKGCCLVGGQTFFENLGKCELRTEQSGFGANDLDWRGDVNELGCFELAKIPNEGACVTSGGACKFQTEAECKKAEGEFYKNFLCTAEELNTICEKTAQTSCVEGKEGVYFVDSCGNTANIYDSSKTDDQTYWEKVISEEDSCGWGSTDGNANSKSCGNCQLPLGGLCSSAVEDNFNPNEGDFYCKDTSCMFDGKGYEDGESWCLYDGKVGDGDDTVGSRHFRYSCNKGEVDISPCMDFRGEICVQSNSIKTENDGEIKISQGACVINNWPKCLTYNTEEGGTTEEKKSECEENLKKLENWWTDCFKVEDIENGDYKGLTQKCFDARKELSKKWKECYTSLEDNTYSGKMKECDEEPNCKVTQVNIADHFGFEACTPEYPPGYDVNSENSRNSAQAVCSLASQKCTVVREPKTFGGCKIVANEECLSASFTEKMNDFCRGLGDCGGEANYIGTYSKNYAVSGAPELGFTTIERLKKLADTVDGNYAEVENYDKVFSDLPGMNEGLPQQENNGGLTEILLYSGIGLAGIAYLGDSIGIFGSAGEAAASASSTMAPFASFAIGAGIGLAVGAYLAEVLELSPGGSILFSIGSALVGGALGQLLLTGSLTGVFAIFGLVGVVLIVLSFLFGSDDCDPIEVDFTCKPWQPPAGGADCEKCNDDPLRPCSEYSCNSLGAACTLINKGSDNELCIEENPDDVTPPVFGEDVSATNNGGKTEISTTDTGFKINPENGGCFDSYTNLEIEFSTDEPAFCRYDIEPKDFEEMSNDFGSNFYLYDHKLSIPLQDPSHGESHGIEWGADTTLYIKCVDKHGSETLGHYTAQFCVNQGDDGTAPVIKKIIPASGHLVGFDKTNETVKVITNELATCKWDTTDKSYDSMTNSLQCSDIYANPSSPSGYVCKGELLTPNSENNYYFRCKDQPWLELTGESEKRNANAQSTTYQIKKPSRKISIDSISPNTDFETGTRITQINLDVRTSGGGEFHRCSYSMSGYDNLIEFFETGTARTHLQSQSLLAGRYHYYIQCKDETGDYTRAETQFRIIHDTSTPQIARVWQDGGTLHFITTEEAECKYSTLGCGFSWSNGENAGNGLNHEIGVTHGETYSIKCRDEFGNTPTGCSIQVRVS